MLPGTRQTGAAHNDARRLPQQCRGGNGARVAHLVVREAWTRASASCAAALIALVEHALDQGDGSTRRTAPARTGPLAAHSYLA